MKVAVLSPVAWRTPPRHYGPWEQMASNLTEGLVKFGLDVTLFATGDSVTAAKLDAVTSEGYEENKNLDAKVLECLHISNLMEKAAEFDIVHNHFDFLPLTFSNLITTPVITTIHGFSSSKIIPVYKKYNATTSYVSISNANRQPELDYVGTVYNGVEVDDFAFIEVPKDYLLFFGRIHPDKGTWEAIQIAKKSGFRLIIAGIIQDESYFREKIEPELNDQVEFIGHAGPEQRRKLLGNAIALLHPINFDEPFGLSVAESMCCGTPVIAFNKGSMPELINHGSTGFIVQNIDEAAAAIQNIKTINRSQCREWAVNRFSSTKMVSDYISLYNQII